MFQRFLFLLVITLSIIILRKFVNEKRDAKGLNIKTNIHMFSLQILKSIAILKYKSYDSKNYNHVTSLIKIVTSRAFSIIRIYI